MRNLYMNDKKRKIKIICVCLIMLMMTGNFAAIISDNDGSAFVTKKELDTLKADFSKQIDNYNTSIDNKTDGAIAEYLAGVSVADTEEMKVASDIFTWPLQIKANSFWTDYDDRVHTIHDYVGMWHRGTYVGFGKASYENPAPPYNFVIVSSPSYIVSGSLKNHRIKIKTCEISYAMNASGFPGHWYKFFNLYYYNHYDSTVPKTQNNFWDTAAYTGWGPIYDTSLPVYLYNNYYFYYESGGVPPSNYNDDIQYNGLFFGKAYNGNLFRSEVDKEFPHKYDKPMDVNGIKEGISYLHTNKNNISPVVYQETNGKYKTFLAQYAAGAHITKPNYRIHMSVIAVGGAETIDDSGYKFYIDQIAWPGWELFDQSCAVATGRDWYECSGVKAKDLQYETHDVVDNSAILLDFADGMYLSTAKENGRVTVNLKLSDTGTAAAGQKTIMFNTNPIPDNGTSVAGTAIKFTSKTLGLTTEQSSYTFPGNITDLSFELPKVNKDDKIFLKIVSDSDFDYTEAPTLNIVYTD